MTGRLLEGRVALVTGGESGIGAACVAALAKAGAHVGISYHSHDEAAAASAATVEAHGGKAVAVKVDVGDEDDVERGFDAITAAIGVPDILINSAGMNMTGVKVEDMELDQWRRVLAADLTGSFLTSRRFVRDRRGKTGAAAIINITSIHAFAMRAGGADYDAAKGGQANLTRTLALEVAERGITVNAIAPGMILTPMNERAMEDEAYREKLVQNIPAKRAGKPEEVADVAVFLASPAAAYITGATIVIDGGLSLIQAPGA